MKKSHFNFYVAFISVLCSVLLFYLLIYKTIYKLISPGMFLCLSTIIFISYFIYVSIIYFISKSFNRNTIKNLAFLYLLVVLSLTFDKGSFFRINLNPLRLIYQMKINFFGTIIEFLSNLVIYIPLGIYIRSISNKKNSTLLLFFLIYILFIESIQAFFHRGVFDINDIIVNSLGFLFGLLIILPKNKKDDFH